MSKVQWNISSEEDPIEELSDDELPQDPPGYVPSGPEPETPELDIEAVAGCVYSEESEEENDAVALTDANLRIEQGRLYQMLMTADIFGNLDCDEKAIKNVQRELRRFAKDRMEVMLGMKKPTEQSTNIVSSPFNHLEVEVLKTLAAKLSGGNTQKADPKPAKSNTLNSISSGANKSKNTVKAALQNLGVPPRKPPTKGTAKPAAPASAVLDPNLANKKIEDMSYDEKLAYNSQKSAVYDKNKISNPEAIPMPSLESLNSIYGGKALTMKQIESNFKGK